ncbi:MAG: hypothetical protein OHK0022_26030 [Roseiflexaceae bacterium]
MILNLQHMLNRRIAIFALAALLLPLLAACGGAASLPLYQSDLVAKAQEFNGKNVTVIGAYLGRGNPQISVLALGTSTLDNGLDAQPFGELIWLDGFPEAQLKDRLHQPGDAVYGFVSVSGVFETGGAYGPDGQYRYRIAVSNAEPREQIRRNEVRIENRPLGEGKLTLFELADDTGARNGQQVTTRGYYFWNGPLAVLAEGVSTDTDGTNPQPVGKQIWMEGFPPDQSSKLNLGPNNSFVWGLVEVTGEFKSGGAFGKDGAYKTFLQVAPNGVTVVGQ